MKGNVLIKLYTLKSGLCSWEKNIQKERKRLKGEVIRKLESLMQIDCDDEVSQEMMETKLQLNWEINKDEIFWEQRPKVNWVKAEDRNTKFFHQQASPRRKKNSIRVLEDENGDRLINPLDMAELTKNYFSNEISNTFFREWINVFLLKLILL